MPEGRKGGPRGDLEIYGSLKMGDFVHGLMGKVGIGFESLYLIHCSVLIYRYMFMFMFNE